jgi:hypothetical protein
MKSFKEFLTEKNDEEDQKVNAAYLNLNSQLNPYNSNWTTDMYLANVLSPKPNMGLEKTYNTDVGIAFDQDADTGELYGSPEGFKAVNKRTKEDRNIKLPRSPTADELRVNLFNILSGG